MTKHAINGELGAASLESIFVRDSSDNVCSENYEKVSLIRNMNDSYIRIILNSI
jgi:hypothetical protein